ncbi:MAG: bifunctional transaldolase/phosoglucose isomerase, partial [Chloroflexi bacterium]|nr:bifunctional transaldolase/phosoglucose isomerase [Chloroflexota bacterium]
FSLESYEWVAKAYLAGLERRALAGEDVTRVDSVASFFVSRVDTVVDRQLESLIRAGRDDLRPLLGQAAIANSKLAYARFRELFGGECFAALLRASATPQRPLWASTRPKNPQYSVVRYVEALIGPDTVNTVPPGTLAAFKDQGRAAATLEAGLEEARHVLAGLAGAGIDLAAVTRDLQDEGVRAFIASYDKLLANIDDKRARLRAKTHTHSATFGAFHVEVDAALADLQRRNIVARVWAQDHTVWKPDPREIADRLGWLTVADTLQEHAKDLAALADEIRAAGFTDVVLLGMGGSSLAPEVLRATFGKRHGYPRLRVLDSTVPAWVRRVTRAIDPARTLFIVSSKSGGTLEVLSFFKHFHALVVKAKGERAGENFIAITDPGTNLQRLAEAHRFRRVFLNPPDIGGRYSALTYFGLVPAALTGVDVHELLARGGCMAEACASCVPAHENPGAWLGAALGTLASAGRDKVTFVTSPVISTFGLWAEQLIAESTGKEGRGILPVALEPLMGVGDYGNDRLFAYLRLDGDDNRAPDDHVAALERAGQPVIRLTLRDRYDLGAEFFRWEFATAIAGALLGIHPFDQPNVQESKDNTAAVLREAQATGQMPPTETTGALADLLAAAQPGDYLAIMAYVNGTPQVEAALEDLRSAIMGYYHLPNTLGYGPRFLHSTGQLHKGGTNNGLFVQLVADWGEDLAVPGEAHTFGKLAASQGLSEERPPMIRAVLFDLDGTLVKTEWLTSLSYAKAVQALSPTPVAAEAAQEVFKEVVGRSREEVSTTLLQRFGLEAAARARLGEHDAQYPWQVLARLRLRLYDEMLADVAVLRANQWPHNVELLRAARRGGCRTALASMSYCDQVMRILRAVGLEDQFDVILSRDDVEHPKPDPEIYLTAARLVETAPADCLVIEDSPAGVQAAVAAGMNCIAVATPLTRERLHSQTLLAPEWIVDDPATLPTVVERLMAQRNL